MQGRETNAGVKRHRKATEGGYAQEDAVETFTEDAKLRKHDRISMRTSQALVWPRTGQESLEKQSRNGSNRDIMIQTKHKDRKTW